MERAKYLQAREKHPEKWNDKFQEQLENIEARIAEFGEAETEVPAPSKPAYIPAKGTEHLVHAEILRGHRYSPTTGKPLNTPFVQMFSIPEFRVFKESATRLGYQIIKVLYEPTFIPA